MTAARKLTHRCLYWQNLGDVNPPPSLIQQHSVTNSNVLAVKRYLGERMAHGKLRQEMCLHCRGSVESVGGNKIMQRKARKSIVR